MTSEPALNFGPQWLRDSLQEGTSASLGSSLVTVATAASSSSSSSLHGHGHHGGRGHGEHTKSGPSSVGGAAAASFTAAHIGSKLATMKLAEFRYGREEMLALFDAALAHETEERQPPDGFNKQGSKSPDDSTKHFKFIHLWVTRPQIPLNLQGPMSEEEQRTWQRGANSEASLRIYHKDDPMGHVSRGGIRGGRGGSLGGIMAEGRGRGRGVYERHRSLKDEEEGGGGRGRGRGSWFDRSLSTSGAEDLNGGGLVSPRKGYTRAPYDDWRKPSGDPDPDDGWRSGAPGGANNSSGDSRRRFNNGWRNTHDADYRRFGSDRDFVNGGPTNPRWKEPIDGFRSGRGGATRFGSSRSRGGSYARQDSGGAEALPEWASDEADHLERGGSFDAAGKFRTKLSRSYDDEDGNDENWKPVVSKTGHKKGEIVDGPGDDTDHVAPNKEVSRGLKEGCSNDRKKDDKGRDHGNSFEDDEEVPIVEEEVDPDDLPHGQGIDRVYTTVERRDNHQVLKSGASDEARSCGEKSFASHHDELHLDAGNLVSKLVDSSEDEGITDGEVRGRVSKASSSPPQQKQVPAAQPEHHQHVTAPQDIRQHSRNIEWMYLDPQGQVQGPFSSKDMMEWFSAGYFPRDLMLRRTCDHRFIPLPEMSRLYGNRVPFDESPTPTPPPPPPPVPVVIDEKFLLDRLRLQMGLSMEDFHSFMVANPHIVLPRLQQMQLMLQQQRVQQQQQHHHHHHHHHQLRPQQDIPESFSHANSDSVNLLLQQRRQQFGDFGLSLPVMPGNDDLLSLKDATLYRQQDPDMQQQHTLGQHLNQNAKKSDEYDPIKSLLTQLQHNPQTAEPPRQQLSSPSESGLAFPSGLQDNSHLGGRRSLWDSDPSSGIAITQEAFPAAVEPRSNPWLKEASVSENKLDDRLDASEPDNDFVHPRANEKKDKRGRKSDERKKQKEVKKSAHEQQHEQKRYIPGMTERPLEASGDSDKHHQQQNLQAIQQRDALQRLQDEQRAMLEREQQHARSQENEALPQIKLAPWAKPNLGGDSSNKSQNAMGTSGFDPNLAEIQRLEAERERELRQKQKQQQQQRALELEQEERERRATKNWASAASTSGAQVKSLAEIQAEEALAESQRKERERQERMARQKEMNLAQASVWGNASANLTWASRANSNNPGHGSTGSGFWEEQPSQAQVLAQAQKQPSINGKKGNSAKKKANKEEERVSAAFKDNKTPKNEFESWCSKALGELNAAVDIPTFLAFLQDIDSPYEVHDYVKNYIGEGKNAKNFAKEYLERRSKYKNSLKSKHRHEDDLLTPAAAINPLDDDPPQIIGTTNSAHSTSGNVEKGNGRGGRKKGKKDKASKGMDANHLLGFSVTAAGNRVNAGELDMPQ